jgi:hypothetical protein
MRGVKPSLSGMLRLMPTRTGIKMMIGMMMQIVKKIHVHVALYQPLNMLLYIRYNRSHKNTADT